MTKNSLVTIDPTSGTRAAPTAPLMLSVSQLMRSVLANSVFLSAHTWSPEEALDYAHSRDIEGDVIETRQQLSLSMTPAPLDWLNKRLGTLWTMRMAGRPVDKVTLTVWMAETASLLSDLPHDIVAFAIDEAIRKTPHGFVLSVGEIRSFADPLVEERRQHIERLGRMESALADPAATAEREQRRRSQEAYLRIVAQSEERAQ